MQLLPYPSHSNSLILHFLPFPGEVRENDPSQEFGTQGAIQALYQLRHHGQQYLGLMLSHDLDTPLTQWSYCRPDILVCWMQLQGQGQCRMTKASQLQVTSRALLSFWTSISFQEYLLLPRVCPVLTVILMPTRCRLTSHVTWHRNTRSLSLNSNDWSTGWISFKCTTVHTISCLSKKAAKAKIPWASSHLAETSCLHPLLSDLFINLKTNSLLASNWIRSFWRISWPLFRPMAK